MVGGRRGAGVGGTAEVMRRRERRLRARNGALLEKRGRWA